MQGIIGDFKDQFRLIPLLWLSLAFLLGIALAAALAWPLSAWLALAVLSLLALLYFRRRQPVVPHWWLAALLLAAALGGLRYQLTQTPATPSDLAHYLDSQVSLIGRVNGPPITYDGYIQYRLEVESLRLPDGERQDLHGRLQLRLPLDSDFHYGDRLRLDGRLESPDDGSDFSYADYLERFGMAGIMAFPDATYLGSGNANPILAALYGLRQRGLKLVYQFYPDPEASLLAGILLGDESGLSDGLKQAYNETGLRHIIAISGFNITIIAGLLLALFGRWLGARRGAWLAAAGIALYTILVGADAAVLRAAIMGGLALLAGQLGRRQFGLNTLALTAALMCLANPLLLWDVGFQLSFAATLGILLYADRLAAWTERQLLARLDAAWAEGLHPLVVELLVITLAAQITTLPLLLYHFQRLSVVSLPANILVLPVQPALMVLGGLSLLAGLLLAPLGQLLAWAAWPLAAYSNRLAELLASLPGASLAVAPFSWPWLALTYLLLFSLTLFWGWLQPRLPRPRPALLFAALGLVCLWLWSAVLHAPDGRLSLTLLNLPDGEALLLQTPEGRRLLVNGGSSAIALSEELGRWLPPMQSDLDWLVVAGTRQEALAGLVNTLERLNPGAIAWAGERQSSPACEQLQRALLAAGYEIVGLEAGQRFDLGQGAGLQVLAVGPRGALLQVEWEHFRALLPLGLDFEMLEGFDQGWALGPVDLLLLADNGYPALNPPDWIENLSPLVVWLSAGGETPSQAELDRLLGGRQVLRTDADGWLQLSTDGRRLWLQSER